MRKLKSYHFRIVNPMTKAADRRTDLDITQKQLATLAGVSKSTVERLERGFSINPKSLKRIAKALVVDWRELSDG